MADYIVREGDSLSSIAAAHGVPLSDVERLNPDLERGHAFNLIFPGDVVHLPFPATPTPPPPPPPPPPVHEDPGVPANLAAEVGRVVLFVGTEAHTWGIPDFVACAQFARAHNIDSICVKRLDGSIKWYGTPEQLAAERAAVLAEGCGYLPFGYAYGPRFSWQQIADEVACLKEMQDVSHHVVTVDMEDEWFGQPDAVQHFSDLMGPAGVHGHLIVSCYANPLSHAFPVARLTVAASAYGPQQYNDFLQSQEQQWVSTGAASIYPALDLTQEFGRNDVVGNAMKARLRGHPSLWLWEYGPARQNPALLDRVVAAFRG